MYFYTKKDFEIQTIIGEFARDIKRYIFLNKKKI